MPAIRHHKITVEGLGVFVREAGDPAKPSIVLLPGYPSSAAAGSPTSSISSRQRASSRSPGARRWTVSSSRNTRRTLKRGLSDENGSWKTI